MTHVPPRDRRRHEAGHTLLELTVASTVMAIFAVVSASASTVFFGLLDDLHARAENVRNAGVIRARLLGDARTTTAVTCAGSDALQFAVGEGAGLSQIEYTASEGMLLRWLSATDRQTPLAADVLGFECNDLGEDGLEVEITAGGAAPPFHLYFHVARKPEEMEEEEEEGEEEGGA